MKNWFVDIDVYFIEYGDVVEIYFKSMFDLMMEDFILRVVTAAFTANSYVINEFVCFWVDDFYIYYIIINGVIVMLFNYILLFKIWFSIVVGF